MDLSTFLVRVGDNLRKARWVAGCTQEQLAERSGVTARYVQQIEAGSVNVSMATLLKLAYATNVSVSALTEVATTARRNIRSTLVGVKAEPPRRGRKPKSSPRR